MAFEYIWRNPLLSMVTVTIIGLLARIGWELGGLIWVGWFGG